MEKEVLGIKFTFSPEYISHRIEVTITIKKRVSGQKNFYSDSGIRKAIKKQQKKFGENLIGWKIGKIEGAYNDFKKEKFFLLSWYYPLGGETGVPYKKWLEKLGIARISEEYFWNEVEKRFPSIKNAFIKHLTDSTKRRQKQIEKMGFDSSKLETKLIPYLEYRKRLRKLRITGIRNAQEKKSLKKRMTANKRNPKMRRTKFLRKMKLV